MLEVNVQRETVCVRKIVGKKTVEIKELATPAVYATVTKEVDVIEWECSPVMRPVAPRAASELVGTIGLLGEGE